MAFPRIDTCIVCEGARPEPHNKNLLFGFFGIAPYVRVLLRDFNLPVTFCFVFCGGEGSAGKHDISLRLTDPQGSIVSPNAFPDIKGGELGTRATTNIFMVFQGKLGSPGTYRVSLIVDGVEHYSTTVDFTPVSSAPPVGTVQ
jgi:hypothetical protein